MADTAAQQKPELERTPEELAAFARQQAFPQWEPKREREPEQDREAGG